MNSEPRPDQESGESATETPQTPEPPQTHRPSEEQLMARDRITGGAYVVPVGGLVDVQLESSSIVRARVYLLDNLPGERDPWHGTDRKAAGDTDGSAQIYPHRSMVVALVPEGGFETNLLFPALAYTPLPWEEQKGARVVLIDLPPPQIVTLDIVKEDPAEH